MSLQSQQHTTKHDRIPLVFTPCPSKCRTERGREREGEKESSQDEIEIGRGRKEPEKDEVIFTLDRQIE